MLFVESTALSGAERPSTEGGSTLPFRAWRARYIGVVEARRTRGEPNGPSRRTIRTALVAVCAVLASSCGGSGDLSTPAGGDTILETVAVSAIYDAASGLTERMGGKPAFIAAVLSLDRGYSIVQLVEGASELTPDGWIGDENRQLDPDGAPLGIVGPAPTEEALRALLRVAAIGVHVAAPSEGDQYVAFLAETLAEIWIRVEGRTKWGLPGEEVDQIVDGVLAESAENRRIEAEFDALFAPDPADDLTLTEERAVIVTMALVGQGYSLEQALQAIVLGDVNQWGHCLLIPGAEPVTPIRTHGCEALVDDFAGIEPASLGSDEPAVDDGPTTWVADLTWDESHDDYDFTGGAELYVTRSEDGTLKMNWAAERHYVWHRHDGDCTTSTSESAELTSGPPDEYGWVILAGDRSITDASSSCPHDAESDTQEWLVRAYLDGTSLTLENVDRGEGRSDLVLQPVTP